MTSAPISPVPLARVPAASGTGPVPRAAEVEAAALGYHPRSITIEVRGTPAPQGSKVGIAIRRGGVYTGAVALLESSRARVSTWRDDVLAAGLKARNGHAPLSGPLVVSMVFTMRKPASAPKRKRTWPCTRPDLSKLARSTEDALTSAGIWGDDGQVIRYFPLAKVYPGEDPDALDTPGVRLTITEVTG